MRNVFRKPMMEMTLADTMVASLIITGVTAAAGVACIYKDEIADYITDKVEKLKPKKEMMNIYDPETGEKLV